MTTCLNCENEIVPRGIGDTNRCLHCELETEIVRIEHGWGDYWYDMQYRFADGRWIWVPTGTLPIFFEATL
jgi:hypothetical protein